MTSICCQARIRKLAAAQDSRGTAAPAGAPVLPARRWCWACPRVATAHACARGSTRRAAKPAPHCRPRQLPHQRLPTRHAVSKKDAQQPLASRLLSHFRLVPQSKRAPSCPRSRQAMSHKEVGQVIVMKMERWVGGEVMAGWGSSGERGAAGREQHDRRQGKPRVKKCEMLALKSAPCDACDNVDSQGQIGNGLQPLRAWWM